LKRRIQFHLLCLALSLFFGQRSLAGPPFIVDVWGTGDGLPQSSVIALAQTHDGYLWLGTLNGLVRFDGKSFTRFNVNNTPGLPGNRIVFLFEDSRHILWAGTEAAGLCAVKNGVVQNFPGTGAAGAIACAFEDGGGDVWFSARSGKFFLWKDGKLDLQPANVSIQVAQQLFYRSVHLLVPGKDGITWQLQDGDVKKLRGGKLEKDYGASPWQSSFIYAVRQMPEGQTGVVIDANIAVTYVDAAGNLVVGIKNEGLFWFQPDGGCFHITKDDGLSHNFVLSLSLDREGNLWAGTDGGGLDRIRRKVFFPPAGLPGEVAQSIAPDAAGGLWVAFNSRGISHWLTNSASNYSIGTYFNAWTVLVDRRQQVWAGTRGEGLFQFMDDNFQPVPAAEQIKQKIGREIFVLFEDRAGKIWAGGENGLGGFDGTNWNFFTAVDGLPASAVRALAEDAQGNLWIGTERDGLFQMNAGKIASVSAPVNDISCLLAGADGGLWVGTSGHGLARFQNGSWKICSTLNGGLASDSVGYLLDDGAGNLWIGSYEGLMRVEKKSLAGFAAGTVKTVSCRTFLTRECSAGAQPAAVRAADGKLFFPTIAGVVGLDPADLQPDTNPPPVVIESVLVDGVEQKTNALNAAWNGTITLAPENEQLEIRFASLNFSAPKNSAAGARFKYRLEGREKNWTDIAGERVAHFNRLPPGKFVFHVIACNEDGVWNEAGAVLAVTVEPPFWRTPAFLVFAALVSLGALAGIVYLVSTAKLKRQLRAHRQKELLEKERARIARDLHDQLGANLTQVALLGELAEADKHLPGEVELHAQQISLTARDTTRSLDEIVWALNSSNDTLESLVNYACKYAQDYFALAGVSFRADLPTQLPPTPILPEVRHNVFLAFKEAVNNVVKHAQATEARVKLRLEPDKFVLTVADNGRGLGDLSAKRLRNGLKNMRKRLADVHGELEITSGADGGTVVKLTVPVKGE
jgi:signal transduction histidine kinase/ligand-binding sensor domain-containing protein